MSIKSKRLKPRENDRYNEYENPYLKKITTREFRHEVFDKIRSNKIGKALESITRKYSVRNILEIYFWLFQEQKKFKKMMSRYSS